MEAWQVLLLKQRTPKPASSTENAQVVGSHSGEPAKEWTISWSMEPMIPSQRAELNCHHEDHIQHKHPKIGLSRARKKLSISLTSCFFGYESPFTGHSPRKNWTIAVYRWPSWAA